MKKYLYFPSSEGKTKLHGVIWEPETQPKAIVQIVHGMVEYVERYEAFAKCPLLHLCMPLDWQYTDPSVYFTRDYYDRLTFK